MTSEEMKQMLERTHKDLDIFDFDGKTYRELCYPIDDLTK